MLTVYGIETEIVILDRLSCISLQQCLPFTVLKPLGDGANSGVRFVATVLTVYGIETYSNDKALEAQRLEELQQCLPFTVLKLRITTSRFRTMTNCVATVLTVYGIETCSSAGENLKAKSCNSAYRLRY